MFLDPNGIKLETNNRFPESTQAHNSLLTYQWPPLPVLQSLLHPLANGQQGVLLKLLFYSLLALALNFQTCAYIFYLRLTLISLS